MKNLLRIATVTLAIAATGAAQVPEPLRESIFYVHDIVAYAGYQGLVTPYRYVSVNSRGTVAFAGRYSGASDGFLRENLYTWNRYLDASTELRLLFNQALNPLDSGSDPTQSFHPHVVINNGDRVVARRYLRAIVQIGFPFGSILTALLTYLESWDASLANAHRAQQIIMGHAGSPAGLTTFLNPLWAGPVSVLGGTAETTDIPSAFDPSSPFTIVHSSAWVNNVNQAIFTAVQAGTTYLVTRPAGTFVGSNTGGLVLDVRLADNGRFIFHRPGSSMEIRMLPYNFDFAGLITV